MCIPKDVPLGSTKGFREFSDFTWVFHGHKSSNPEKLVISGQVSAILAYTWSPKFFFTIIVTYYHFMGSFQ